jgi:hypothetical protein
MSAVISAAAVATERMGMSNSKDYCAHPDSIFYYAAPFAKHLYANARKARPRTGFSV